MPIDIDNTDVSDITIDGQNVSQVTADGNVVWNAIPDSGVSRWGFDEGSGSTAIDSWGNNDGTINGATYTTTSYVGSHALSFDGIDDEVNIPEFPAFSSYSMAAWLRPNNVTEKMGAVSLGVNNRGKLGIKDTGDLWFQMRGQNGKVEVTTPVSANTYTLGVFTWDGSTLEGFKNDATSAGTVSISSQDPVVTGQDRVGENVNSDFPQNYDGIIDDVRIYDKALTSTEVSNLYNTGSING